MHPEARELMTPDYAMLVGYFVLMLGIGFYFYRHMKQMKDYFSGGNAIPWWLSGVSFYMTSFSVMAFVNYPAICYKQGWVGITLLWVAIPATLFSAMVFGGRWRRARIQSPVEYLETRYSPVLRQVFAWQGLPVKLVDDGIKLVATATFISVSAGLDPKISLLSVGTIMLLYTFMGGLWAVAVTDFIQFVVLTVGVIVVLPLSISKAGGLTAILNDSPKEFFSLTSKEYGWEYILPLVLLYGLAWSSINWSLIQRYYCVPKEKDARKVGWLVIGLYIVGPPLMFFPAMAASRFIPNLDDAGHVYPALCNMLLPAGMLGLIIAAMFAATMSTLSSDYNVCASVLTNDIYRRLLRPHASERELVQVGRVMTLVVGIAALGTAYVIMMAAKSEGLFRLMVTLFGVATAPVAVPMLLGLVSKRFTSLSAIVGFFAGTLAGLFLLYVSRSTENMNLAGVLWDAAAKKFTLGGFALDTEIAMFLSTTVVTFVVMAVVSLLIPASVEENARVKGFLARLDVPIGGLPEDAPATGSTIMSPFRIVGICIIAIGAMMAVLLPWVMRTEAGGWTLVVTLALFAIGAVLMMLPQKAR